MAGGINIGYLLGVLFVLLGSSRWLNPWLDAHWPSQTNSLSKLFQITALLFLAFLSYKTTSSATYKKNQFSFDPMVEVGSSFLWYLRDHHPIVGYPGSQGTYHFLDPSLAVLLGLRHPQWFSRQCARLPELCGARGGPKRNQSQPSGKSGDTLPQTTGRDFLRDFLHGRLDLYR